MKRIPLAFAQFVYRADIGMIQRRGCFSLGGKAAHSLFIMDQVVRENLQSHGPVQPGIQSPVHYPHPARSQRSKNLIRTELPPDERFALVVRKGRGNRVDCGAVENSR